MKSKKLLAAVLGLTVLVSSALVGCGSKTGGEGAEGKEGATTGPDKEQYLNLVLAQEPRSLDGSKSTDLYSSIILNSTMEGLTRIEQDENGNDVVKAAGAEKWDVSEDGLTWTFHLRDFEWADGQKVTAEDFVYGITRTLAPETGAAYSFLLYPIKGAAAYNAGEAKAEEVGVKALDEKTLEIKLEGPCAYFLDITYFKVMYPMRKDMVEQNGDKYGTEANTLVFNGPFVISEWVHQNKVELVKNDKYWDKDNVKLDKVTLKIIKEETTRMQELLNGSLDSAAVSKPEWKDKFNKEGKYEVIEGYDPSTSYDFFNQKDKLFSNEKVRKAFSLAVDRQGIVDALYRGVAAPAFGWAPPSLQIDGEDFRQKSNYEPIKTLAEENPDPKALLIEGLKELGLGDDPSKITVNYLEAGTDARAREFAEYFQQMYQDKLGVVIKVEYVEWPQFMKRTDDMDYQLAGMAWTGDYNDPMTFFDMWMSDAGIVPTGYDNPDYDALIKKAQGTLDQNVRFNAFKEAEKILLYDDAVIAPTVYRRRSTYRRSYVKNLMSPLFGSSYEFKYAYTEGRE